MSNFIYSDDNKRYHTLNYYNKQKYGKRVFKAALSAGFTCPNIDGTKGSGGCNFCGGGGGYFTAPSFSLEKQLDLEIKRIRGKYPDSFVIAYFQSNTNTYASLPKLKEIYLPFTRRSDIAGISIGTRPDCLSEEILDFLGDVGEKTELTVELGLQTIHDQTAALVNRCYQYETFVTAYKGLKRRNIRISVHLINGLPGETLKMMIESAKAVAELKPDAIKIHLLHIIEGTELARKGFRVEMTRDEYISLTSVQLGYFPPLTVIERLTGDGDKKKLISPLWAADKRYILGKIDRYMEEFDICQGDFQRGFNRVPRRQFPRL